MLVLHIGLPKTGTTLLQHRILARSPGIAFVHRRRGGEEAAICWGLRRLADAGALAQPFLRRRLAGRLRAFAAALPAGAAGQPIMVSEENVAILPRGFWEGRGTDPGRLARRLAALARQLDGELAPLRVVIGIRRQDQWLASRYAESSKHFPGFGQVDFDRRMAAIAGAATLAGPLGWLDADAVRRAFHAALGPDNVLMVPLERLAGAEAATRAALGAFLGGVPLAAAPRDRRRPGRPQRRNRLSEGEGVWRLRRDGAPLRLEPAVREALVARFAASNRALAAEVPLGYRP